MHVTISANEPRILMTFYTRCKWLSTCELHPRPLTKCNRICLARTKQPICLLNLKGKPGPITSARHYEPIRRRGMTLSYYYTRRVSYHASTSLHPHLGDTPHFRPYSLHFGFFASSYDYKTDKTGKNFLLSLALFLSLSLSLSLFLSLSLSLSLIH
ncbi:unnamed protein product [Acanthosepion pharaonis]|uniref:Uncharacterized protein n=1 Tax=Acanthosepion pharaonis TaxID=158019 RepID=A0A812EEA8_ACAPH|nr:unnamed protein product [Sepia pharaonis]